MGRRAADPATPVPVLGVPASVGGWKTTGDRSGGVLLQTWGHCSVGIQTSPGISRPPAQLPDTPSDNITQTSSSSIAKESEVTSLLTKNNNEKGAILRQKSGETKIKKEVTFKALGGDTSKEGGIYCYATAIRTNPLIAASVTGSRTKPKSVSRYMNGSVVDSEAIGGISVVNDEAEAGSDLHLHKTDQSRKMMPLSVIQALAVPQKMCNLCGGRQSTHGKNTHLPEKPLVSTTRHFQVSHIDAKFQQNQQISEINTDKTAQISGNPRILYLNEELRYRKIPHPACPVHSRGKMMTLSHPNGASDGTSIQHATTPQANATAVTQATIEPLSEMQQNTIQNQTPRMTNSPLLHTHPNLLKTTHLGSVHNNSPQDICVSVHATPNNALSSPASIVDMRSGNTSCKNSAFNPEVMPSDSNLNAEQEKQISNQTNAANILQMAPKCITLTNHVLKSDHPAHHAPASPAHEPSEPLNKLLSSRVSSSPGEVASIDTEISQAQFLDFTNTHITEPRSSAALSQSTLNHKANPDQITFTSTKDKSVASQSHSAHPKSSTSEPNINTSASSLQKAFHASKPLDSFPAAFTIMYPDALHKNFACRNIKTGLEKTAGSLLSPLTEKQNNVSISSTSSLQLADIKKVLGCNEAPDSSRAHHTQAANTRRQESNEPTALGVTSHQESNSRTTSELQNVSENLNKRNKPSTFTPGVGKCSETNKVRDDQANELVINESKDHEKSIRSRGSNTQNYVSLIKSSSSCLQGCLNTEQQSFVCYQGYTGTKDEGRCATSPPVNTDSNTQQFPQGASASHAHSQLKPNADRQTSYISPSVPMQTNCEPIVSNTRPITSSPACQNFNLDIALQKQTHTSPERCVRAPASFSSKGQLGANTGHEYEPVLPSFTMLLVSSPQIRSSEVEANSKLDSKFIPCVSESFLLDRSLAHSHPAEAAPVLPSSQQLCRSAALELRLKAVEASLAANKDRITTLLNIIHDLERVSTPRSHRRCCTTGLDLKNCSTCQKTACIVYSVEYDFRQQERHFLEVLNRSAGSNNRAFSARLTQPLNFSLLKNTVVKNLTKTKLKSKKLCKTLLKWLPRKIQQH